MEDLIIKYELEINRLYSQRKEIDDSDAICLYLDGKITAYEIVLRDLKETFKK